MKGKLTVRSMHLISLNAPRQPRNETKVTIQPVAMRMAAEDTYRSVPKRRSMKLL